MRWAGLLALAVASCPGKPIAQTAPIAMPNDADATGTREPEMSSFLREGGAPVREGDARRGRRVYENRCANCHGPRGEGNGPLADDLVVKPRDLTRKAYMRKLSRAHLYRVVHDGGESVGLSSAMPAWGDKLSEEELADVLAYVRIFSE